MIWRWHIHKLVLLLPDSWSNWNFLGEGKTGVKERTNNQLNPHLASTPGFEPLATLVGGNRSHHCAIPSLDSG